MNHKFFSFLALITLLGFFLRLNGYDKNPPLHESDDELHYAWAGLSLITTGIPTSWSFFSSYPNFSMQQIGDKNYRIVSPMLEKPPFYLLLSGLTVYMQGHRNIATATNLAQIRILPLILSVFTIFLTGLLTREVFQKNYKEEDCRGPIAIGPRNDKHSMSSPSQSYRHKLQRGSLTTSEIIGLIAALLYAINPFFILGNRLSVTENLLTPLILLFLWLEQKLKDTNKQDSKFLSLRGSASWRRRGNLNIENASPDCDRDRNDKLNKVFSHNYCNYHKGIILGIIAGLCFLTKQAGVCVIITGIILLFSKRNWQTLIIFLLVSISVSLIYPLWATAYNWQLFMKISAEIRRIGLQGGLPQTLFTIISRPLVGTEKLFIDLTWLLGMLLLFSSPLRLFNSVTKPRNYELSTNNYQLIAFPFVYLTYLCLTLTGAEAIGSGQAFWGWYAYPLFPFLTILVSCFIYELWQKFSLAYFMLLIMTLGSGAIRYFLMFLPRAVHYRWQWLMAGLLLTGLIIKISNRKLQKSILFCLFVIYIGVNIFTSLNLQQIYP